MSVHNGNSEYKHTITDKHQNKIRVGKQSDDHLKRIFLLGNYLSVFTNTAFLHWFTVSAVVSL